ncbi:MAG: lipase maturation factor family protein [Gammaproteobacteria bacterium]|nr:lipase maturation factor family protein [Gammaproteobacteria bacterium]
MTERILMAILRPLSPAAGYELTARLFLRSLALIYLAAFYSASREITGLIGADGVLPAGEYLHRLFDQFGAIAWLRFPTLFWLDHGDTTLLASTWLGMLMALLLLIGWRPLFSTSMLFVLYLSLFRVGQLFFNFQWDYLLLEVGFLSIFLTRGPTVLLVFLFHWLLFRLRFLSGLSKLLSGDPSWAGLTTLQHYFETQPLPHMGAWHAHHLPVPVLQFGTGLTLFVELLVPFFIFLPRPFRLLAAALTIGMQLLIIATSNHNFINLLTIALCLFLLDDRALRSVLPWRARATTPVANGPPVHTVARPVVVLTAILVAGPILFASTLGIREFIAGTHGQEGWNTPVNWVRGWGLGNVYHVYPTMQTERQELSIEGSLDGRVWRQYRFRYKPNTVDDRPAFIVPLHPRIDWMIWFIPPQNEAMRYWFERFLWQLKQGSPAVLVLLANDPFAGTPPRYLRVMAYRYRFTTPAERAGSGRVWDAELLGQFPFVPPRRP